jgi:hypothetical protein
MALSANPVSKVVSQVSSSLASAANQKAGNLGLPNTNLGKANLDKLVADKAGMIGSKLNGLTGQLKTTSLNNLSSTVQSIAGSGGINSLTSGSPGGFFKSLKGQFENLAAGVAPGLATGLIQGALQGAAAQGNLLAGLANDLISAARSKNLPSSGVLGLTQPGAIVAVYPVEAGDWRVKVQSLAGTITFPTTPTFTLSHTANYASQDLVHANYPHPVYKNSSSGDISLSCEWPVETTTEAEDWYRVINLGRALTKMFYGASRFTGNPPPICTLIGYQNTLRRIPVVVTEFKVDFKDDVHYVSTGTSFIPRLSTITMNLRPVYSKSSQRAFNWDDYAKATSNIPY